MASVKVYGPAISPAVSRVLACLLEKEVPFELVSVDMSKGEHKTPDFLKIQPFGQVPAFQDENRSIFESRAICRYIVDKYANQGTKGLLGTGWMERASIDQWLESESQSFNPPSITLVFQLIFAARMKVKQDPAAIESNSSKLAKVLDVYDHRLGQTRYLAGEEFSLADLSHLPNSHLLVNMSDKAEMFHSRKNVSRWWEEISNRPAWKKTVELHKLS